jgi:hypothetical protein
MPERNWPSWSTELRTSAVEIVEIERVVETSASTKYDQYLDAQLTEKTGDRDHDSSDECGEARKQHKVTQEHRHTRASPSAPYAAPYIVRQCLGRGTRCEEPSKNCSSAGLDPPRKCRSMKRPMKRSPASRASRIHLVNPATGHVLTGNDQ